MLSLHEPSSRLLQYTLAACLNHVAVTRNDSVKVPCVHPLRRFSKASSVLSTSRIPQESPLPYHLPFRVQSSKQLGEQAGGSVQAGLRVLLCSREVEDEICLDHSLCRLVQKYQLFILMGVNVFVVELVIELWTYPHVLFIRGAEHMRKFSHPWSFHLPLASLGGPPCQLPQLLDIPWPMGR